MNRSNLYLACLSLFGATLAIRSAQPPVTPPPPALPPPEVRVQPTPGPNETYVYEQKLHGTARSYLVSPEQAQAIINRFKESYPKIGSPRVLIYVNRELIDENSGMKLSARKVQTESVRGHAPAKTAAPSDPSAAAKAGGTATGSASASAGNLSNPGERVTAQNTYRFQDQKQAPLTDRQTVRDIERLFGRPLRMAGVALADQQIASQTLPVKSVDAFKTSPESDQARRDREALSKVADVVIEILMSSRNVTVTEVSGDKVYSVPDLQATAIRLKDARIIGQATASDIIGSGAAKTRAFDVREVTEATALSLMQDIMMTP